MLDISPRLYEGPLTFGNGAFRVIGLLENQNILTFDISMYNVLRSMILACNLFQEKNLRARRSGRTKAEQRVQLKIFTILVASIKNLDRLCTSRCKTPLNVTNESTTNAVLRNLLTASM